MLWVGKLDAEQLTHVYIPPATISELRPFFSIRVRVKVEVPRTSGSDPASLARCLIASEVCITITGRTLKRHGMWYSRRRTCPRWGVRRRRRRRRANSTWLNRLSAARGGGQCAHEADQEMVGGLVLSACLCARKAGTTRRRTEGDRQTLDAEAASALK